MDEFKDSVKRGFAACRSDIDSIKLENDMLKSKLKALEATNSNLNNHISDLLAEVKGIKIALDYIKDFKETQNVQEKPAQAPDVIYQAPSQQIPVNQPQNYAHTQIQPKNQDPYEALLAFKAKSNKREMLKQKLISMINEGGMNLSELKFMFVEHFRYCSKATFYNYLKELEAEQTVTLKREQSKTFIHLTETLLREM